MTTNEKLRLISEGLREHQERQVELFIMFGRFMAVVIAVSLVVYLLYKFRVFQRLGNLLDTIFGKKETDKISK